MTAIPYRPAPPRLRRLLLATLQAAALSGCAGYQAFHEGQAELARGNDEQGLARLRQAADAEPENIGYRNAYFSRRDAAVAELLRRADAALQHGELAAARDAYERAARIDPASPRAVAGPERVATAARHAALLDAAAGRAGAGDLQGAIATAREVLALDPDHARAGTLLRQWQRQQADTTGRERGVTPKLRAAYRAPVSLSFSNASLQQAFDSLNAASGLNYVFDRDVRADARVTLSVTNKPVEDILRLLLATNQLDQRVLDDDTLLIYPNTPAKAAEYREMVVRTFYLRHADSARLAEMLRTIAKVRDVVVDDKLNALVVRDSADVVRQAERLVASQDLAEPEVVLELEVLEISSTRLQDLGVNWPSGVSASIGGTGGAGHLTWDEARHFTTGLVKLNFSDPAIGAQISAQVGDAQLLANPRIRVRNRQSAKALIGQRVPVFTTTTTANVGSSESVNYLDVGLKLDIQPTISPDGDVAMAVALEVSNIVNTVTGPSGTQAYLLGTRNTSTTLQVHDGETNVLAGLIQKEDRGSNTGLPWLNELPLLGKLFGAASDTRNRTEIVLLITPHIVRNVEPPGVGQQEWLSGTDSALGAPPIQLGTPYPAAPGQPVAPRLVTNGATMPAPPAPTPAAAPPSPAPAATPAFTPPPITPTPPGSAQ